jgi:hypothetical protein
MQSSAFSDQILDLALDSRRGVTRAARRAAALSFDEEGATERFTYSEQPVSPSTAIDSAVACNRPIARERLSIPIDGAASTAYPPAQEWLPNPLPPGLLNGVMDATDERKPQQEQTFAPMGRAGIEPATLRLRVSCSTS